MVTRVGYINCPTIKVSLDTGNLVAVFTMHCYWKMINMVPTMLVGRLSHFNYVGIVKVHTSYVGKGNKLYKSHACHINRFRYH